MLKVLQIKNCKKFSKGYTTVQKCWHDFEVLKDCYVKSPGGGVTSIYTGTGRAIFGGAFFEQGINFGVSFSASPIMDPSLDTYFQHELNFRVFTLYGI